MGIQLTEKTEMFHMERLNNFKLDLLLTDFEIKKALYCSQDLEELRFSQTSGESTQNTTTSEDRDDPFFDEEMNLIMSNLNLNELDKPPSCQSSNIEYLLHDELDNQEFSCRCFV